MRIAASYRVGLLLTVSFFPALAAAQYGGGKGTAEEPYLIVTVADLRALAEDSANWDKHFRLMADLDLSGMSLKPIAAGWYSSFSGVFDGNGHTLSHFTCPASSVSDAGLFASIAAEGVVKNLGVTEVAIQADGSAGGLAVYNRGTIIGCFATGQCAGYLSVGGLVAENRGTIIRCFSTVEVSGDYYVGGLVGELDGGLLAECYAAGRVSGDGGRYWGGLVGNSWSSGEVRGCFWDTQASGKTHSEAGQGRTTAEMQAVETFQSAGWDFIFADDGPDDAWAMPAGGGYPILWWQAESLPALPAFGGGTGTPDDPFLLATAEHFNLLGANPRLMGRCYRLAADIDLTGTTGKPIGADTESFEGSFDGAGHEIRYQAEELPPNDAQIGYSQYAGPVPLFGSIGRSGLVENLGVVDVKARSTTASAALAARNKGIIRACYATGNLRGYTPVGGLVADNAGQVSGCYSDVAVSGYSLVGGLAGRNEGTIENCYATGAVSGSAGLVSENTGTLSRCYAAGPVSASSGRGGLVAKNTGVVFDCFWDVDASGQPNSAAGKGRRTAQMQETATFLGWGGCDGAAWTCDEGIDYPRLVWETRRGAPLPPRRLAEFLAGSGAPEDPYVVTTPEQIALLGAFPCEWDKSFRLEADLDLSGCATTEYDRIGFDSSHAFTGVFDGGGHWIRNWTCVVEYDRVGLFGCIGPDGCVTGLGLDHCTITGAKGVGGLAGVNGGTLSDCHVVAGLVCGDEAGLLAGRNEGGVIASCSTQGSCTGSTSIGGLAGVLQGGRATSCSANAAIVGHSGAGGLIGTNTGLVTSCRAEGTVSADGGAGGLIGFHSSGGWASNCYSLTVVTAGEDTGGLIGRCDDGIVTTCYAAGPVVGGHYRVGGLIGDAYDEAVASSFWDTTATGQTNSQGGLGKTTVQMQMASTFLDAGWDFENIWTLCEGRDYPRLQWEKVSCPE
jgi:hypothetical protein